MNLNFHLEANLMRCPRCQSEMGVIAFPKLGGAEVCLCPECDGSWYPKVSLTSLMIRSDRNEVAETDLAPTLIADKLDKIDIEAPVECPECSRRMRRFSYVIAPGVDIDECEEHGIWLDDGELGIMLDQVIFQGETLSEKRDRLESERRDENLKPTANGAISPFGLTLRVLNSLSRDE